MVHQSNAYFERCHAADFDATVRQDLRRECWARWLEHYTPGQPPDRVEYAQHRLGALDDGERIEPLPGMRATALGSSHTASFLTTTSDGDTAPTTAETAEEPGIETPVVVRPPPPTAIGPCADVCAPRWDQCIAQCDNRANGCTEACEHEHRTCMRGCF